MNDKAKRYSRIKYTLAITGFIYLLLILLLFQISGLAIWLRATIIRVFSNQFLLIFVYSLSLCLLYFILNLPLEFYRSYIIEHRFDLSNQRLSDWFSDEEKLHAER